MCNGTAGSGQNALVRTGAETAGTNCANGGVKMESGLDANGSGVLDDSEVDAAQIGGVQADDSNCAQCHPAK